MRMYFALSLAFSGALPCQSFFPPPPAPTANPPSPEKALLGMALFWEEQLSATNTVACGTCHSFAKGGTDARPVAVHPGHDGAFGTADDVRGSHGVTARDASLRYTPSAFGFAAQATPRRAPSVINAAYLDRLFYDGRARDGEFRDPETNAVLATGPVALENLVLGPPVNPVEMGAAGRTWTDVAHKIEQARPLALADHLPPRLAYFVDGRAYPELFEIAFGTAEVTPARIVFAIATYLRTLVSDQTRYDWWLQQSLTGVPGPNGVITATAEELRGELLFRTGQNSAAACVQCHGDISPRSHGLGPSPVVTTMYGSRPSGNFHNTGLRPIAEDPGASAITGLATDQGRFKVPLLRNVALHATFGHGGQMTALEQVVDFYDRGGDFHANQAPEIGPRNLPAYDRAALVAFLRMLTDPRVEQGAPPFDSPRLGSERGALQPAVYGVGTPGTGGDTPQMLAQAPVLPGDRAVLGVSGARAGAPAFVIWDLATIREGIDVFGPRIYAGFLQFTLVGVGLTQTAPDGTGYASQVFAVPAAPGLGGLQLYAQWLVLDPEGPGGGAASAPAEITLQ